jgi:hypothetical protein
MTNMAFGVAGGGLMGHGKAKTIAEMALSLAKVAEPAAVPHMVCNKDERWA